MLLIRNLLHTYYNHPITYYTHHSSQEGSSIYLLINVKMYMNILQYKSTTITYVKK